MTQTAHPRLPRIAQGWTVSEQPTLPVGAEVAIYPDVLDALLLEPGPLLWRIGIPTTMGFVDIWNTPIAALTPAFDAHFAHLTAGVSGVTRERLDYLLRARKWLTDVQLTAASVRAIRELRGTPGAWSSARLLQLLRMLRKTPEESLRAMITNTPNRRDLERRVLCTAIDLGWSGR